MPSLWVLCFAATAFGSEGAKLPPRTSEAREVKLTFPHQVSLGSVMLFCVHALEELTIDQASRAALQSRTLLWEYHLSEAIPTAQVHPICAAALEASGFQRTVTDGVARFEPIGQPQPGQILVSVFKVADDERATLQSPLASSGVLLREVPGSSIIVVAGPVEAARAVIEPLAPARSP